MNSCLALIYSCMLCGSFDFLLVIRRFEFEFSEALLVGFDGRRSSLCARIG